MAKAAKMVSNWRMYAALEACRALGTAKLTDTDRVVDIMTVLDQFNKRLEALEKVRKTFDFDKDEDREAWKTELEKEFTPAWTALPLKKVEGIPMSADDLRALREVKVVAGG